MSDEPASLKRWMILYRGPLSSCNYGCDYCPFAKRSHTREELADDAAKLRRFVDWVSSRDEQIGILFTPWGEALVQRHYQEAIRRLSHMPQVWRVAAQTNLSYQPDWLEACNRNTAALWCTFHPSETELAGFVKRCHKLDTMGLPYSVGIVGKKEALADATALRAALHPSVYLWINAWKRESPYYSDEEIQAALRIDPLFHYNLKPQPSLGRACRAGHETFTVDGEGDARRCHFISATIGNIYQPGFENALQPRACTNAECRCHIGYVHMHDLRLDAIYGDGILERIPRTPLWPSGSAQADRSA